MSSNGASHEAAAQPTSALMKAGGDAAASSEIYSPAGPGWYPDPERTATLQYWNGSEWEDMYAPMAAGGDSPPASTYASSGPSDGVDGIVVLGYILAVVFPIGGFVVGLTQIRFSNHGVIIVVLAMMSAVVWFAIGYQSYMDGVSAELDSLEDGYYPYEDPYLE